MALLSLILMIGCSKENELPTQTQESTKFYASIEVSDTRTYADENGKLLWTADDRITVFKGNAYARQYRYTGQTGLNSGEFNDLTDPSSVITGNALSANYAVYPYDGSTSITNEGIINYTIPATQNYAKNSFGLGANTMVAVTKNIDDNFLAFKNIGGYFEFSLYGDVTVRSIEFKGNNNEKLAGAVTITATNGGEPTVAFSNEATKTITLDCGASGIALGTNAANTTKFWFVVPAITYSNGITITITDTDGKVMTKSTSKPITINRSTVQPLDAFLVETEDNIPNNQIWYTSTDGNIVTPKYTNTFGATYKSNVYENGKGIITFEGDVLYLGASVFYNCTTLSSIIMPNSASVVGDSAFQGCQNLTSVVLSNSLTSINTNAFIECKNLAKINIPESVKEIKKSAFAKCSCLTNVNIPQNVNLIGKTAFTECVLLSSVTIGSNVTNIDEDAFCYCKNLSTVYCKPQNPPTLTNSQYCGAFYNCASNLIIYVPTTSVETYKAANGWKDYADKIEGYNFE